MSDELEPGYLLVLVIRHYPRAMGRNNSLVQCLESGKNLRINVRRFFICPTGSGGSGGERKIIETRRPAKHNGGIEAVAGLDQKIDGGEIMQKRGI